MAGTSTQNLPSTNHLRPYLAPVLLDASDPALSGDAFHTALRKEIRDSLTSTRRSRDRKAPTIRAASPDGDFSISTFLYSESAPPPWAPTSQLRDVSHQLVVLATRGRLAAICTSDAGFRNRLARELTVAKPVARARLEAAFVGENARAMWLSGIHTSTQVKPDAKMLMGSALEFALDPLGDQTYYYSAVRTSVNVPALEGGKPSSIGAVPEEGRIWIRRPDDWAAFVAQLKAVMTHIAATRDETKPFASLARPVNDLAGVTGAYDLALVPTELLTDEELTGPERELALNWTYSASFKVTPMARSADFRAEVVRNGTTIGTLAFNVTGVGETVATNYDWTDKQPAQQASREECLEALRHQSWLKIYYDSGHTVSGSRCFLPAFRDQVFGFKFKDLSGFNVKAEKPKTKAGLDLARSIGETTDGGRPDNSLFAFALREFNTGWLASDDGSMEFADFVHIDAAGDTVTLIHIKAAGSIEDDREVSVSKYEVVVGQAIKNLRYLDRVNLREALETGKGKKIGAAVWLDGTRQRNRNGLIAHAGGLRPNHKRRVVIIQPQLTETEYEACDLRTAPRQRIDRFKQLNTLLLAASLSAQAVGATIEVWGAE